MTARHLRDVFDRVGVVQIDSVNVLVRSHYLPFFSRLGPYDRALLDRMAYRDRHVFEYWGHEASLLPVRLHRLLRWRMDEGHAWSGVERVGREQAELVESLRQRVLAEGPVSAAQLDTQDRKKEAWWGWGDTKRAVEHLLWSGEVAALRRPTFERTYCDPRQVLPAEVLDAPTPPPDEAMSELLLVAARGHGVGTAKDLADYFRIPTPRARPLLEGLAAEGRLARVAVEGWRHPAYLHPEARLPRWVRACALVSPFDSVMWERTRVERVYGFRYVIEIYVPKSKRVHGYYVLPFLYGDRFVARTDLKADRAAGVLRVQSAFLEPLVDRRGPEPDEVAAALAGELRAMAGWLGLPDVAVAGTGDLSPLLAVSLA